MRKILLVCDFFVETIITYKRTFLIFYFYLTDKNFTLLYSFCVLLNIYLHHAKRGSLSFPFLRKQSKMSLYILCCSAYYYSYYFCFHFPFYCLMSTSPFEITLSLKSVFSSVKFNTVYLSISSSTINPI